MLVIGLLRSWRPLRGCPEKPSTEKILGPLRRRLTAKRNELASGLPKGMSRHQTALRGAAGESSERPLKKRAASEKIA